MFDIRNRLERGFGNFVVLIYENRYKTLLIMLALVAILLSQLPKITFDLSSEGFLHENDPIRLDYNAFRDQFGREELLIIALRPPEIFDLNFLTRLRELHDDLEENVPHLDDIKSLINARNTHGQGDTLFVDDLLQDFPNTQEELSAVKQRALENPMYKNLLLSEDGKFTTIVIQTSAYSPESEIDVLEGFDDDALDEIPAVNDTTPRTYLTDKENGEVVEAVEDIVKKHPIANTQVFVAGSPIVMHFLKRAMLRDMPRFLLIAIAAISVFLFVLFRRISAVLMPLCIVILSILSTFGLMAIAGVPFKLPTQILPSFLLAVGVGDSVHILVIFFQHFNQHGNKKDALAYALSHSGLAVLMTSVTTAAGLLSFSTAAVDPIANLGIFASIGVMLAFIFTVILLPALLTIFPIKPASVNKSDASRESSKSNRLLTFIANISINHPYRVLVTAVVIVGLSIHGITMVKLSHDPVRWLPATSAVRVATHKINDELKGSINLEVVIDTGRENGLYDPEILNELEKSVREIETFETETASVGKAWCITTILKEINQALHGNNKKYYTIPEDRQLVAQEFLLFENSGSDDLEDVTDSGFSKARFSIILPSIDAIAYADFIDRVGDHFKTKFPEAEIKVTGMVAIYSQVFKSAIISMGKSYVYALIIITILMVLLIGRVRIGLLSMIPNITPILIMVGIMGWLHLPMDMFCMLVGSIAIGLAVDDTIHFMHNFRRYFEESHDPGQAIIETLHTAGKAMLVTTCVLSIGFFTFMISPMNNLTNFGFLTGITITTALLSDFFIAPSLMVIANRKKHMDLEVPMK